MDLLVDELGFFLAQDAGRVCTLPGWECLPYDRYSPHPEITSQRIQTMERLCRSEPFILLLCPEQILFHLPVRSFISGSTFNLSRGTAIDPLRLRDRLADAGYLGVSQVMSEGEYAIRGGIIDVFPMGADSPFRLDLFGDEIEKIRLFDPDTQKSTGDTPALSVLPAREFPTDQPAIEQFRKSYRRFFAGDPQSSMIYREVSQGRLPAGIEFYLPLFFESPSTIFDYLPQGTQWVVPQSWQDQLRSEWAGIKDRFEHCSLDPERQPLSPEILCLNPELAIKTISESGPVKVLGPISEHSNSDFARPPPSYPVDHKSSTPFSALTERLGNSSGPKVLLSTETPGRARALQELLAGHGLHVEEVGSWPELLEGGFECNTITSSPLDRGLVTVAPPVEIIVESQLYGERVHQRRKERTQNPEAIIRSLAELHDGDPVVHIEHGVGRFGGLHWLDLNGQKNEFLVIRYLDDGKLYVPVLSINVLSRYIGGDPENAPLHRLGSDQWRKAKKRATKRAHDAAAELLKTQALRTLRPGRIFSVPQDEYMGFRAGFSYDETPDQEQAIEEVLADLGAPVPMDRLVCGDVGFGKTEVALRAAFVVAQSGYQVAVLTPTTLLANQHYDVFNERFADYPVRIESLSRFKTQAANRALVNEIQEGAIDIVVGTHRLLQQDLDFRNLGLVIIDEEHRFGVRQKERLKQLREEVDVLTLTATPIPRTLNIALAGLRSISLIGSPPPGRVSIKTTVNRYSNHLIREACLRELHRGGQVYFLHNDVSTIERVAEDLRVLIPEASIEVGHGQMPKGGLESVMRDFYHQRFDILVCSTIIESGIDVPTANTIIMNRADRFGLAQLHQLRGRVGRSRHQAFAFLLVPDPEFMSEPAKRRLEAIENLTELGAGFALANHDLEIRGAGELLGEGQSGIIEEIGFSMYSDFLNKAIRDLSGEKLSSPPPKRSASEVDTESSAYIPEAFIHDVHARLMLYQRISDCEEESALYTLKLEM
ncbi:MAG TPA: transcription-repair coupling factor, partial [Gammaproteobacteria bacterium]|nr:transcription-repair coupling factor [Gammaproteobacteria bacterium]